VGWASPGEEMPLTHTERAWALRRAREQATGADREVVDVLPVQWTVRGRDGEREVDEPIGELGNHLTCQALLVTARRGYRAEMAELARGLGLELEDVIPQPLALYRGVQGKLRSRGSSLVIDFGARHTNVLVRRKDKLLHVETFGFGGDDLTARLSERLGVPEERAELIKREIDIGTVVTNGEQPLGQQYIWADLQERHALLGPATRVCAEAVTAFFKERAKDLREHGYLGQQGQIHLVGRSSALSGLALCLRDIFDLPVVLGTGDKNRHPSGELDGLLTTGLVRAAADHRRERLEQQATSLRKRASGMWTWLTHALT
jgi:cell division ATPase FtsA